MWVDVGGCGWVWMGVCIIICLGVGGCMYHDMAGCGWVVMGVGGFGWV